MTSRASLTAEYMALFRALESSRPAGSRLFADPDASLSCAAGGSGSLD